MTKPRPPATLQEAGQVLARIRAILSECPACERVEADRYPLPGPMIPPGPGWRESECEWAWIKPCSVCAVTPMYPWAVYLDAERVQKYLNANANPGVVVYADLEALTRG